MTTRKDLIQQLRAADEDDVGRAVAAAYGDLEAVSEEDLLEFFNRMLDTLLDDDEDADEDV